MHIAQASGCAPVVTAFNTDQLHARPVIPKTIAKSLAIGNPADAFYALDVARRSRGTAYAVPEEEVAEGIKLLAQTEGIFTETAGGVVISTLRNIARSGVVGVDEHIVALITGNGLKTQEAIEDVVDPITIDPSVDSFDANVMSKGLI